MTVLEILAIVLAVLAALLLAPISVRLSLQEEMLVSLRYLFFRFSLYPPKEKKKKTKEPPEKAPPEPVSNRARMQELRQKLLLGLDILHSLGRPLKKLIRGITLYDIELKMTVQGEEPSEAAIAYGQYNAWLYGATAALKNFFHIKNTSYQLTPLYTQGEEAFSLKAKAKARPVTLLAVGILFGWRLVKSQLARKDTARKKTQEGQKDETDKTAGSGAAQRV